MKEIFRYKRVKVNKKFVDAKLRKLLIKKRQLFKKFKITNNKNVYHKYEVIYKMIGNKLNENKDIALEKYITKAKTFKELYYHIKCMNKLSETNIFLTDNNEQIVPSNEICQKFSGQFANNYSDKTFPNFVDGGQKYSLELNNLSFNMTDLLREILKLNIANGPLEIPTVIIKKNALRYFPNFLV